MAKPRWKHEYVAPGAYDVEQKEGETELQYYRRLAKVTDQRMVRLEKLSQQPGFKGVKKFAYHGAKDMLEIFGGNRFNTKPPEDRRLFHEKIMTMRHFLTSPTSTKSGIIETYQKRAETLNKIYGTNFTWKDLSEYFDKGLADKMAASHFESKTALYAIGRIRKTLDKVQEAIANNTNVVMDGEIGDGPVSDAALAMLRKRSPIPGTAISEEEKQMIRKALRANMK